MKAIEIKIYKFDELSEQAKQVAIQTERSEGVNTDHIYSDAKNTVDQFCEVFGVRAGSNSLNYGYFEHEYLDEILDFSPERLRKYIINNFGYILFAPKQFSLWSKKDISFKHYKNGYPVLKKKLSKVIFQANNCNLTGVCYDESILQPIYEFLNRTNYHHSSFEDILNECFETLSKDIDQEIKAMQEDEYISENLISNDYDFLESGEMY